MKIKTKITLGVGLLFLLIILLGTVGAWYALTLESATENILVANYNTLEYSENMIEAIEHNNSESLKKFESNLKKQENNNTEIGEKEATSELRILFDQFKNQQVDSLKPLIRSKILTIMEMNMNAILRKSDIAKQTANHATTYILFIATSCFLIAFTLLINLPSHIANPIQELTESIKAIAAKNYSQRVNFQEHNEFGELADSFNTMAKKLEEYNNSNLAKLMLEKKRIETLINNISDPVLGLDENLNVVFANNSLISVLNLENPNLLGVSALEISIQNDLFRVLIQDILQKENKNETLKIFANGKESHFEKNNLPIYILPTGEKESILVGYVIVLKDVTIYKELDYAKTNFLATVSHEFKTPLSSIQMSLNLLQNPKTGSINEEQESLILGIKDDAKRLLKITGELLNVTQLESGKIQLSIQSVYPQEIINYSIQATQVQAAQKNIQIELNLSNDLSKIMVDIEKTTWVLVNIISNAIRYSYEHSKIIISVAQNENYVIVKIQDFGQGISPQYLDKIFERYFRVPGISKEGTGLGLAISKDFIEAQGGKIEVESEFGAGSSFIVSLKKQ